MGILTGSVRGGWGRFFTGKNILEKEIFSPKSIKEMASDLRAEIGKNSVKFRTPNKTGHIDLEGDEHYDKLTGQDIPTPHVQTKDIHVGPNGKISASRKSEVTRPATKADIRIARRLAEIQNLFNETNEVYENEDMSIIERGFTP